MTTLRKLLLAGNPLRTLRRFDLLSWLFGCFYCFPTDYLSLSSLVNGPTPALLKYLRSRLPVDEGILYLLLEFGLFDALTHQALFVTIVAVLAVQQF